jgi:hypothetical protein
VALLSLEPVTWRVRALAADGRTVADSHAALLVLGVEPHCQKKVDLNSRLSGESPENRSAEK